MPTDERDDDDVTTFVFDGDCSFCTACANFVTRWIPTRAEVVPWQRVDLGALGLPREEAVQAVQWVQPDRKTLAGPEAIGALLRSSNAFWKPSGWVLALPPVRALAWPLYRVVARNRHRMPGGTAACAIPVPPPAAGMNPTAVPIKVTKPPAAAPDGTAADCGRVAATCWRRAPS